MPHNWKESVGVPINKKDDKTDFSNYRGVSLYSSTHEILSALSMNVTYICRRNYWASLLWILT
jgi:hypothetical protein